MKEIKFKYYYKHKRDGDVQTEVFTLEQIEQRGPSMLSGYLDEDGYECIAKEPFTGLIIKAKEVFRGDIRKASFHCDNQQVTRYNIMKWDNENSCFYWDGPESPDWSIEGVIGSIHTHPQLLNP